MSTRTDLKTLIRLAPEVATDILSDAACNLLLDKAQADIAVKGRALPKNEKVNAVAEQQEYVVSGASSVLTDDDFLEIDLAGGGVLFSDGSRWIGPPELTAKTPEWLDLNYPDWRTNSSTTSPSYYYLAPGVGGSNLVVGLVDKPDTSASNVIWIHWLGQGVLMTDNTHYPWTGTTTELAHLREYDILFVYYVLEFVNRAITKQTTEADKYLQLYLDGTQKMRTRLPLSSHLAREGMKAQTAFQKMLGNASRRRR